jgi:hypothetical protein
MWSSDALFLGEHFQNVARGHAAERIKAVLGKCRLWRRVMICQARQCSGMVSASVPSQSKISPLISGIGKPGVHWSGLPVNPRPFQKRFAIACVRLAPGF